MASKGYVEAQLNRLETKVRSVLIQVFTHVLDNLQIGGVSHQEKAANFRWIRIDSTTSSTANDEFTVVHGAGQKPLYVLPFMPLDSSGAWLPRLKVTRAADASRLYFSSPDTNAPFSVLMEI
jgi:hypothetical protein